METSGKSPGPIEAAVLTYHPTPAVLYEAGALDRELAAGERSWNALLRSMASFISHYPSVLLHSPVAAQTLGRVCLQGIREAPGQVLQTRSASLLVTLLANMVDEVHREGAQHFQKEVPGVLGELLLEATRPGSRCRFHGHLSPPLLGLGKQILTVGDCDEPESWLALLAPLTSLLLEITKEQVQGEPSYDGRWDEEELYRVFRVELLEPLRQQHLLEDLRWLAEREKMLAGGASPVEIFLEISAWSCREERARAWERYFLALAGGVQEGSLEGERLRQLGQGIASWIEQARDPWFLEKLAWILKSYPPRATAANRLPGLLTVLETFGRTIIGLLEKRAGSGDTNAAYENLRSVVADMIASLLAIADKKVAADAMQLGLQLRTGPLNGAPFSLQDVVWRLNLADRHSKVAEVNLLSLIAGFSLEEILLQDDRQELGRCLAALLGRSWGDDLFLVRAAIRKAPLSPFHLGGPGIRTHLLALDPEDRQGSYLHDLKVKVLSRSGPGNLKWVEKVLLFWRTGSPACLDGLASPRSLTNLPSRQEDEQIAQLRDLLENLSRHVPVADKSGVAWLARMPETYYQASTLMKVAGFPGCSEKAVTLLEHLLNVYRALYVRYNRTQEQVGELSDRVEDLLEQSRDLLESRRLLLVKLFRPGGLEGLEPVQQLEAFEHEMALVREEVRLLEALAERGLAVLDRENRRLAESALGHMLQNASMSGLGTAELPELAEKFQKGRIDESGSLRLMQKTAGLLASIRNRLAGKLRPHIEDSARRLMENPLARPASHYRELLELHRHRGVERVAVELGDVLVDELLSDDGGFLLLENFVHRLMHMLERY